MNHRPNVWEMVFSFQAAARGLANAAVWNGGPEFRIALFFHKQ
jgi:hypothetical protein